MDDADDWMDSALCATHGRPHPCPYCQFEHLVDYADWKRKERIENSLLEGIAEDWDAAKGEP